MMKIKITFEPSAKRLARRQAKATSKSLKENGLREPIAIEIANFFSEYGFNSNRIHNLKYVEKFVTKFFKDPENAKAYQERF